MSNEKIDAMMLAAYGAKRTETYWREVPEDGMVRVYESAQGQRILVEVRAGNQPVIYSHHASGK